MKLKYEVLYENGYLFKTCSIVLRLIEIVIKSFKMTDILFFKKLLINCKLSMYIHKLIGLIRK